jgi:hypothetical protein
MQERGQCVYSVSPKERPAPTQGGKKQEKKTVVIPLFMKPKWAVMIQNLEQEHFGC